MAEAPRRRAEGTGSAPPGKPRRKAAGAPTAAGRASSAQPRRPASKPSTTNPLRAQAERLVGELVKTGNLGQREAERLVSELRGASERAQGRAQSAADGLDRFIEGRIEVVLNRVNIPSRTDIERLNKSVDHLTAKVETLLSGRERSGH